MWDEADELPEAPRDETVVMTGTPVIAAFIGRSLEGAARVARRAEPVLDETRVQPLSLRDLARAPQPGRAAAEPVAPGHGALGSGPAAGPPGHGALGPVPAAGSAAPGPDAQVDPSAAASSSGFGVVAAIGAALATIGAGLLALQLLS